MDREDYRVRLSGVRIGAYTVEDKIWQGATSTVFRGVCLGERAPFGKTVAFKVMHPYRTQPNQIRQFLSEAALSRRLNHPNTIRVHGSGRKGRLLYMLMEYVDGRSIRQLLLEKDVPACRMVSILWEAGKALVYIHGMGILHNDFKPENILVSDDFSKVKLIDFGFATVFRPWWRRRRSFMQGGTEKYVSPEQKAGHTDVRSDVYAFGVVLEELLVSRNPAGAARLRQIVEKARQPLAHKRYQTVEDLMQDYREVLEACPVPSP